MSSRPNSSQLHRMCGTPNTVDTQLSRNISITPTNIHTEEKKNINGSVKRRSYRGNDDFSESSQETNLNESQRGFSSFSRESSVDEKVDEEMFCTNSDIWLDTRDSVKGGENQVSSQNPQTECRPPKSLSSYQLLRDMVRADKAARKEVDYSGAEKNVVEKRRRWSKSKFLAVGGWKVEEKQSLLQDLQDCVYLEEGK